MRLHKKRSTEELTISRFLVSHNKKDDTIKFLFRESKYEMIEVTREEAEFLQMRLSEFLKTKPSK
jgi:hypothetical protein